MLQDTRAPCCLHAQGRTMRPSADLGGGGQVSVNRITRASKLHWEIMSQCQECCWWLESYFCLFITAKIFIFSFFPGCHPYIFIFLCFHWALHTMSLRPSPGTLILRFQDNKLSPLIAYFPPLLLSSELLDYPFVVTDVDRINTLWLGCIEILYASITRGWDMILFSPVDVCIYASQTLVLVQLELLVQNVSRRSGVQGYHCILHLHSSALISF